MPKLLLEIGCEELPASACREAETQLPGLAETLLQVAPSDVFVTPRRIAALVDLPEEMQPRRVAGPPVRVAYDENGKPTKAAEGFAKKAGVGVDELQVEGDAVVAVLPPLPVEEFAASAVSEIVRSLFFPKTMRWEDDFRFPRPIRWLCVLVGDEPLAVEVAGLRAGRTSYGHRFSQGAVEIASADAYAETLRAASVEVDARERRRAIVEGLDAAGEWHDPAGVLEEVLYLVESPFVLAGTFDERFLQLPERVVVTAMQSHQRYFPLGGNRFAFVSNGGDADVVRAGNEQVLEGRLEDAAFTFERDVKLGIERLADKLGTITFFAGAGSFADKTQRLLKLVERLGGGEASLEAARLAKADQASELVREFPDLEGHIGAEYARLAGYPEAVCGAIDEHYLPDSAGGPLPQTDAGKVLAAADKIDTLSTSFALGHKPTGSRDPYGLRRAAIGLARLAVEGGLRIDRSLLPDEVRDFVEERLESLLDVPVEYVRAARASAAPDLGGVARVATELYAHRDSPEFDGVYTAFDRAHRLAGKAEREAAGTLDQALLIEDAEQALAQALTGVSIDGAGDVRAALESAAQLAPLVERFFDEVLVMADDSAVRANRLRLLLDVRDTIGQLGDFSQIPR